MSDQRGAVGVSAGGGEAGEDVARMHRVARELVPTLHRADAEAGEVVVAFGIHARHLRRLATDEGAAGLAAALGDAGDHGFRDAALQSAGREIVEEDERLGALPDAVVDAPGDARVAAAPMAPAADAAPELPAEAALGRDQHRTHITPD